MRPNWPYAIKCGVNTADGAVLILHGAGSVSATYVQVYPFEHRSVHFNGDGSYNYRSGYDDTTKGCESQSIQQLYDANKAYNFVTQNTNSPTTSPSELPTRNPTSFPTLPTTSPPTPQNMCLYLKVLSLGSVGDLDRINEEIEISVQSEIATLECGLYLLDISRNQNQNLNIQASCINGEFVKVRFYERDNCNDDTKLVSIKCKETDGLQTIEVIISPDNTETSYSECISSSVGVEACVEYSGGVVGGSFCAAHEWGKEECGGVAISETDSQYYLEYEIIASSCGNVTNVDCIIDGQYYPGPTCSNYNELPEATETVQNSEAYFYSNVFLLGIMTTIILLVE